MSKRSKRSSYTDIFLNSARNGEFPRPSKRRMAPSKNATNTNQRTQPIPLPFVDEISYTFDDKPIHSKSESINIGAENLFTVSTIPMPASPNKPSTSSSFTFPGLLLGSPENISNVLTDTESASGSETSEDELASDSSCQSTGTVSGEGTSQIKKKKMTRSEYYRERLNQIDRAQKDRRERWKKKLENMQTLLNIIKS